MAETIYTHEEGIATIVLNNPPQNRIGAGVSAGLVEAIMDLSGRDDTRVLVIRAEGPDFSFGGDITAWEGQSEKDFSEGIAQGLLGVNMMQDFPFPIVVGVQGHCRGGGFEITLRGDIIIAADNAQFGHSEASIGVFTFLGGVQRVAERVGRTRAMQWALTAEMVDAQKALDTGLINEVVPLDQLGSTIDAWAERLAKGATLAHADHKALLRAWSEGGIKAADDLIPGRAGKALHTKDAQGCLPEAIKAVKAGAPRPQFTFKGR